MLTNICLGQDIIDSRDVERDISDLEGQEELDEDERELLDALRKLRDQAGRIDDWEHGATLIRDGYFKEYAQDLAEEIGAIPQDAGWPCTCIDWDQAADQLQMDYTSVEFGGETYWVR